MKKYILPLLAAACFVMPLQARAGSDVTYQDGEITLQGYWVNSTCDRTEQEPPVVLIVHQWKGLGEYEKRRAAMLGEKCYDAFAIDMYGQGVRPETTEEARAHSSKYKDNPELARGRLQAALDYARSRKGNDAPVATMGYCFGGTMALEQARSGADIDAVISFHGGLATQAPVTESGIIHPAIQVHHGAADPHVPPEQLHEFMDEMDQADADWHVIQYADAVHAFTEKHAGNDPSTGAAYNEKADKRSWAATLLFLDETLTPEETVSLQAPAAHRNKGEDKDEAPENE